MMYIMYIFNPHLKVWNILGFRELVPLLSRGDIISTKSESTSQQNWP